MDESQNDYQKLRKWNTVMAVLHFLQGLLMVFLSNTRTIQISKWLPNPEEATRSFDLVREDWYAVNLGYTISSFLFLSAIAHTLTILPGVYGWYIKKLKQKINLIRWFEYALSSSVMVYVIAVLNGIRDGWMLMLIVGINVCMNLFGAVMEMHNSDKRKLNMWENLDPVSQELPDDPKFKPNWSSFIFGSFAGFLPWIVMADYFFTSLDRLGDLESLPEDIEQVLNTVRFIFPALFIFFNLFAINMFLQYKGVGPWKKYVFGEKAYIILSLTAKSFLAWFIWGGTLRG